ncbi:MAG: heme o synthase [Opitutales bacterium]|nr:heme o synthase [Opitutales bacterium]
MNIGKEIVAKPSSAFTAEKGISLSGMYELTKPRLSLLSVFTASLGYLVYDPFRSDISVFMCLTIGTALSAAGSAVLNQWMERKEDALMSRTKDRPLPAKIVSPSTAFIFGSSLCVLGIFVLWTGTNPWAAMLTLSTIVIYLFLYTPLKKKTSWAIEIGAVSGALPPLVGWVAAADSPTAYGWILFGILFAWQLPHFMAIAWNHRTDYSKGGFRLHMMGDAEGRALSFKSLLYTFVLTIFVFSPYFIDINQAKPGSFYFFSSIALSIYLFFPAFRFFLSSNRDLHAKKLFFVTIIYLPLLFSALVIDRYL